MRDNKVSVAVATFNGEAFLSEQLLSIVNQTQPPAEIIISDDGSTDNTLEIASGIAENSSVPIRIFQNETNVGYPINFQRAAERCVGSILFFSDQDDIWLPNKIESVVSTIERTDALAVTHNFLVSEGQDREMYRYDDYNLKSGLPPAYNIHGCSVAFRRELLDKFGWPQAPYSTGHDRWVVMLAEILGRRSCIPEPLMIRRIHGNNVSGIWGGGDKLWRRLLRSVSLPPFTSNQELDLVAAHWASLDAIDPLILALQSKHDLLTSECFENVISALARAKKIRKFTSSSFYDRPLQRIGLSIILFLTLNYRNGDGVFGLALDFAGKRKDFD